MSNPDNSQFSLKLFLSADLIGSTALKSDHGASDTDPVWLTTFIGFYEEFPLILKNSLEELKISEYRANLTNIPEVSFWKAIGDELLWVSDLKQGNSAYYILRGFKAALEQYNTQLEQSGKKVRLKGTAWIAGFPITHKEVELPESRGKDYIGPYIDTGFRLSKFSTRMKLVISVDLAWLLLKCSTSPAELDTVSINFDESESMKGVLSGRPYPIIWIECNSDLESKEYRLTRRPTHNQEWRKSLRDYCESFINDTDGKLIKPYILGDTEFGEPDRSYHVWQEKQNKNFTEPIDTIEDISTASSAPNSVPSSDLSLEVKLPSTAP